MKTLTSKKTLFSVLTIFGVMMLYAQGAAQNAGRVTLCHNGNTIEVSANAVNAHLAHGDVLGPCAGGCINPALIDPNRACITLYDPVCGCDGVTYSNGCVATFGYGVTSYTPGACNSCIGTPLPIFCPTVYDPVCGCNGQTYTNSCFATAAGILSYTPGACGGGTLGKVGSVVGNTPQIAPNPAREYADVVWVASQEGVAQVEILNALGQVVMQSGAIPSTPAQMSSYRVDVSQLTPGVYLARVQSGNATTTQKFMVQH